MPDQQKFKGSLTITKGVFLI